MRSFEVDRKLLKVAVAAGAAGETTSPRQQAVAEAKPAVVLPLVFLHDRMLTQGGIAMMAKTVDALKLSPETSPIVFTGERPRARAYVALGAAALSKWFPDVHVAQNQWGRSEHGEDVLLVESPERILRFGEETPAVKAIKRQMWQALKDAKRRIDGGK